MTLLNKLLAKLPGVDALLSSPSEIKRAVVIALAVCTLLLVLAIVL